MPKSQSYANHVRWFPLIHFVVIPILLLIGIYSAVKLYQDPNLDRFVMLAFVLAVLTLTVGARLQSLKAQDRVIRLEEKLRYEKLLNSELASGASNLPISTVIALRFASDEELSDMVARTLRGEFKSTKELKKAVRNWRADHLRV